MSLPSGIITRTLTISAGVGIGGQPASTEVVITPTVGTLVWAATGQPVVSFFNIYRTSPDRALVLELPVVDQMGFIDEDQDPVTDWAYKILVRYLLDGRKVGRNVTKYVKPLLNSASVLDFDTIPSGDVPLFRGPQGKPGPSAYDVAVKNGFSGSEADWLASLSTGGVVPHYEHNQTAPSNEWIITHNLGYNPGGVTLVDSAKREFKAEISYIDENSLRVTMVGAQSGMAYIS